MNQRKQRTASPLSPPQERGTGRAFLLAALMHVLLIALLYHGMQWQNSTPAGAEAELWTEVPDSPAPQPVQPAPPVKVAPAPPPVKDDNADIALQQKRRQQQEAAAREAQLAEQRQQALKAEQEAQAKRAAQLAAQQLAQQQAADRQAEKQKQADKLRQQQLADQQKKLEQQQKLDQQRKQAQAQAEAEKKAEADKAAAAAKSEAAAKAKAEAAAKAKADAASKAKLDKERQARLSQLQGAAGGSGGADGLAKSGTGSGSGGNAASPGYADKVKRRVKPFITWGGSREGLETRVQVRCSPSGDVLGVTVTRSSGNSAWDDTVVSAVRNASPLPPDTNGSTPGNIAITFRAAGDAN
ncbi:cell envelope integrity protein TolA [Burkholderia sp. 22PA0106]|uniref:cell envelope integrity protein TolA n=1 Tax=Burkholderia sp. 22PA0106 TaxID=3237371 RepID=UPI0039C19EAE